MKTKLSTLGKGIADVAGVLLPLIPKGACPICLGAYGGILSTLGLGFLVGSRGP